MLRILIVEDEPIIAFDLAQVVEHKTGADVHIASSIAVALRMLEKIDFVFLDMNVVDGKTFDLARELTALGIPYAFTSASRRCELPSDLQGERFLSKPCTDGEIELALAACVVIEANRPQHA